MKYCAEAHQKLVIAGGNRPWLLRLRAMFLGFDWAGPVSGEKKAELLSDAKALIFPIQWEEPFGLVMAEAWLSGTPVLAHPRGSAKELVTSEVGALPASPEAWQELLSKPLTFSAEACRDYAVKNFHYLKMAENYESYYLKAMGEGL